MTMPEFGTVFSGKKSDRKLTEGELIRAIRFSISAEYEAVQLYMQLAESIDNEAAVKVLKDIAEEELVHAGEFLKLLYRLHPEEEKFYREGFEEVEELIGTPAK
jgi:rubrerythrin